MVTHLEQKYDPQDILDRIQKIDEKLSILRESWQDAAENKKIKWLNMINDQLDQRLTLMSIRDNME
jgi:hypothetical protein